MGVSDRKTITWSSDPESIPDPEAQKQAVDGVLGVEIRLNTPPQFQSQSASSAVSTPHAKKRRQPNNQVWLRDDKICSIPRHLSVDDYVVRADRLRPPLVMPSRWIVQGCPRIYVEAVKVSKWRKRVRTERNNAWYRFLNRLK
jgi:hypothetical protein